MWLLNLFKRLFALLLAPVTWFVKLLRAWGTGQLSWRASLLCELVTVTIVVVALAALNWWLELESYLIGPLVLRKVWLGLVALLTYLTIRLSISLIMLLLSRGPRFPDIRAAVQAGQDAVAAEGIDLREVPLFLVIGTDELSENALAGSEFVGSTIRVDQRRHPVHWFGDESALWVTIPGVSAVALQQDRLVDAERNVEERRDAGSARLTSGEKQLADQRMKYLIELLRKIRRPVVPINGCLLIVPYRWMVDESLRGITDAVKVDMRAAQTELGVKCLCLVALNEIEDSPEFAAYVERMPQAARQRRCGCMMPALTEITEDDKTSMHRWLIAFFRDQVYRFYETNHDAATNGLLYRFLDHFRAARPGFRRLLNNAFPEDLPEQFYLGGVYFTELRGDRSEFFDGIAAKLTSEHDEVICWNRAALRSDRRYRLAATLVASLVIGLVVCDALLVTKTILSWK